MAIAYFIPDQAKLLARSASNHNRNNQNSNSAAAVNSNQPGTTTTTAPSMSQQQQPPTYHTNNHHFRANLTIPLTAYDTTPPRSSVGCWDLITQVFCYALRFYHATERLNPAVIQISFEISGGGGGESVATPSATQQQQQQPMTGQDRTSNGAPKKN